LPAVVGHIWGETSIGKRFAA